DGQVITEGEIGLAARLVLAAFQDLENELIAFFAVLPEQRLEILDRRRLERLESVALVHTPDDADDVFPSPDVFGEEIAHPARGFCAGHLLDHGTIQNSEFTNRAP